MIYRKWSLLSSTPVIIGGVIGFVVAANHLFLRQSPFLKPEIKKQNESSSK